MGSYAKFSGGQRSALRLTRFSKMKREAIMMRERKE